MPDHVVALAFPEKLLKTIYTVFRKNHTFMFLIITRRFFVDLYSFCTSRKRNEYRTTYLLTDLMTS